MDISQIRGILHFMSGSFGLVLLLVLWIKGRSRMTFYYGWTILFLVANSVAYGGLYFFQTNSLFWNRLAWIGILILPTYIIFLNVFTGRTKHLKLKMFFWYLIGGGLSVLAITTSYFSKDVARSYPFKFEAGPLEPVARLFVIACLVVSFYYLLSEYVKAKGEKKTKIKYFVLALTIHSSGGIIFGGILPLIFGPNFLYGDAVTFFGLPGVALTTYAIFTEKLFAVKFILTEILVAIIGVILLVQALLAETIQAQVLGMVTFFAFLIVGYLLVKVTHKEIARKEEAESLAEKLKELNETLEERVEERTKELEESYHEIKKRKDELEKFYQLTVGREMKMIELKKKIKELEDKIDEK